MPDFAQAPRPPAPRVDLPIFVMDACDARENPIVAVFVRSAEDGAATEITVVFKDESPSYCGIPTLFLSEPIRRCRFGRWADVESFRYLHGESKDGSDIARIHFDGTFGDDQDYDELWPHHPTATFPIKLFEREGVRPVIYVTTWNHLFHRVPRDLATRETTRIDCYEVHVGDRSEVDALF